MKNSHDEGTSALDPRAEIVLVEDDANDVELTMHFLKKYNFASLIAVARDGAEALEYLHPHDSGQPLPAPRLILLDLKLPKVHGLEVLRRLRSDSRTELVPVVVLTSSRESSDLQRAYALGANSFVCKPVAFDEFGRVIQSLGNYWMHLNEAPTKLL